MVYIEIECVETKTGKKVTFFAKGDYHSGEWCIYRFNDGSEDSSDDFKVPTAVKEAIEKKLNEPRCYRRKRQLNYKERSCRGR